MKKLIISIGVPLLLCSTALWAQEKISSTWTLQDCFEYARDHSITLQQNRLSVEESEVNTKEAKAQLFPSFDFSTSHNYNNYPMAAGRAKTSIREPTELTHHGQFSMGNGETRLKPTEYKRSNNNTHSKKHSIICK